MKKNFKTVLKVLLSFLGLFVILFVIAAIYINTTFLNFEKKYSEKDVPITEITAEGITFLDRNGNGELDIYEDNRQEIEARADDLLSQMTTAEKIHLLKGVRYEISNWHG